MKELGVKKYQIVAVVDSRINRECIARVEDTYNGTWSAANYDANMNSLSYEVCEQLKVRDEDFLDNENMVLMQMAEDMTYYGDTPNSSNIKFHNEFSSTSCPARSLALHGGTNESLRTYVITQIKHYQSLGKTVNEMLNKTPASKGWKKDSTGYWYETEKGQYYKNQFAQIEEIWYYFGETGYMYANQWLEYKTDEWYYFKDSGAMAENEVIKMDDKFYTFGKDGKLNEEKRNY